MSMFLEQMKALSRHRVRRHCDVDTPAQLEVEKLYASDEAAAIERILDDVAGSTESDVADRVLGPLQQTLYAAFLTGEVDAWRNVYRQIVVVVDICGSQSTPAIQRLRAFLAENDDLNDY